MFKHVLVTLDGSQEGEAVIPFAAGIARPLGAEVTFLRIVDSAGSDWGERGSVRKSSDGTIRALFIEQAQAYLDRVAAQLRSEGVTVHTMVAQGQPAQQIISTAKESGADVIAMCTHSRRGINRLMFGSVAEHVLHSSSLPVLLIRT